ncbi:uncharacterized protein [Bemisia tabaci]|uniref:uncharacterized protein n=1 Tax=Bemisia tabaci TaxID=7038 RepID=UPI0008F9855B|nr:PREDICTED: uncharacterized protein LOC109029750 [Bemisia tabaci]
MCRLPVLLLVCVALLGVPTDGRWWPSLAWLPGTVPAEDKWWATLYEAPHFEGNRATVNGTKDSKDCQPLPWGVAGRVSSIQLDEGPRGECFSTLNFFKDVECKELVATHKCSMRTLEGTAHNNVIRSVAFAHH